MHTDASVNKELRAGTLCAAVCRHSSGSPLEEESVLTDKSKTIKNMCPYVLDVKGPLTET